MKNKAKAQPSINKFSEFFQHKLALFGRKRPSGTKQEEAEQRPSNIASDKDPVNEAPNIRKSRLQSWLGESATPGGEQSDGGNGPDSKELSGLALDSIPSVDQEESKAGMPVFSNAQYAQ